MNPPIHILVVDDDAAVLAGTVRLLQGAGFTVSTASTGQAALAQMRAPRPDLLLLDVNLPDLSGLEVCRSIKTEADLASAFVVMLSATRTSTDEQATGLEAGADGYIARPIGNRELLARVQAFVRIQQAEAALRRSQEQLSAELREKERLIDELQLALRQVKTLSGLIPICAGCKKIRDDQHYWHQVDAYLAEHAHVQFTHGYCPECIRQYFPDALE